MLVTTFVSIFDLALLDSFMSGLGYQQFLVGVALCLIGRPYLYYSSILQCILIKELSMIQLIWHVIAEEYQHAQKERTRIEI
jgi:hypothetical protein